MATFVVAHGARSAGWAWKKMRPLINPHITTPQLFAGILREIAGA